MLDKLKKGIRFIKLIGYIIRRAGNYKKYISYSQAGEDRVLKFLFESMGIKDISYLDIGTNNPVEINNTYYFYLSGSTGVCIEPNTALIPRIKKYRPLDICLNIGISPDGNEGELDLYVFDDADSEKGLSTFSFKEAKYVEDTTGIKIAETKKISVQPIMSVLTKYFPDKKIHLVSIDVEGLDLEILKTIDFNEYRPMVFCVETVNFTINHRKTKNTAISSLMESKGYFAYADTGINTIFADKSLF
jgi:FkbM family methyltransferase